VHTIHDAGGSLGNGKLRGIKGESGVLLVLSVLIILAVVVRRSFRDREHADLSSVSAALVERYGADLQSDVRSPLGETSVEPLELPLSSLVSESNTSEDKVSWIPKTQTDARVDGIQAMLERWRKGKDLSLFQSSQRDSILTDLGIALAIRLCENGLAIQPQDTTLKAKLKWLHRLRACPSRFADVNPPCEE